MHPGFLRCTFNLKVESMSKPNTAGLLSWGLVVCISSVCSVIIYGIFYLCLPHVFKQIADADAVSIANTYIVFTTLLVACFAALVTVASFYLAQTSTESKFLKLQNDFEQHLENNDSFAKRINEIAESHVKSIFEKLSDDNRFNALVDVVVKAAIDKMKSNVNQKSFVHTFRSIIKKAPGDHDEFA